MLLHCAHRTAACRGQRARRICRTGCHSTGHAGLQGLPSLPSFPSCLLTIVPHHHHQATGCHWCTPAGGVNTCMQAASARRLSSQCQATQMTLQQRTHRGGAPCACWAAGDSLCAKRTSPTLLTLPCAGAACREVPGPVGWASASQRQPCGRRGRRHCLHLRQAHTAPMAVLHPDASDRQVGAAMGGVQRQHAGRSLQPSKP